LNSLPEVKRFFYDSVLKKEYPDVTVQFIPGKPPVLILLDDNDAEVERMDVSGHDFNGLHQLLEEKGFKRAPTAEEEEEEYDDELADKEL